MRPPILRLPVELQLHILKFLSIRVKKCCVPKFDDYCLRTKCERIPGRIRIASGSPTHLFNSSSCHRITITYPEILSLRCTSYHFSLLIPLTHKLLLEVERWLRFHRYNVFTCCVCMRLRMRDKFAVHATTGVQDIEEEDFVARHRFCVDCGFSTYPHPHPVLLPRRQQRCLGVQPLGLTTYAPGTKIKFRRPWFGPMPAAYKETFHVWV